MSRRPTNAEERIAARYIPANHTVFREVPGGIVYAGTKSTPLKGDVLSAIAYRGTAMNPEWNYIFRNQAKLNDECEKFFASIEAHQDFKAERKASRKHEETDTQKVKKALKAAGYNVVSVHHDRGTASNWINIKIDDYDEYINSEGNRQRRYSEVMFIAKETSGRADLHDDIQTDYFCVNINIDFLKYHRCKECIISNCTEWHEPESCARPCFYNEEMAEWDAKRREAWKAEQAAAVIPLPPAQPEPVKQIPAGYLPYLNVTITEEAL